MKKKLKVGNHSMPVPASRLARVGIGILLIAGGLLGFLPVLGFWMIPLGLLVLSVDIPVVRRWRRQAAVRTGVWLKPRFPGLAERLGFDGKQRPNRRR